MIDAAAAADATAEQKPLAPTAGEVEQSRCTSLAQTTGQPELASCMHLQQALSGGLLVQLAKCQSFCRLVRCQALCPRLIWLDLFYFFQRSSSPFTMLLTVFSLLAAKV